MEIVLAVDDVKLSITDKINLQLTDVAFIAKCLADFADKNSKNTLLTIFFRKYPTVYVFHEFKYIWCEHDQQPKNVKLSPHGEDEFT